MELIYKEIPGYPDYRVNRNGDIYKVNSMGGLDRMSPRPYDKYGHLQVGLRNDGVRKFLTVHGIVMKAFVGECPEGLEVAHENGKAWDNRLENLSYKTRMENQADKVRHGRSLRGRKHHFAKLYESEVEEIRICLEIGLTLKKIADKFGVSMSAVWGIKSGKNWGWLVSGDVCLP